jgi:hypothetical protein
MHDIRLSLNSIDELFEPPEGTPFSPAWLDRSGMDYIADVLKTRRLPHRVRAVLRIGHAPEHSADDVQEAIARYAQAKIDEAKREIASQRWQALKSLQTGLGVLLLALLAAAGMDSAEFLPETLRSLIAESLLIAGWVSMWHPAELILYAWWTPWRQIRIYERLQQMEIALETESSPVAA